MKYVLTLAILCGIACLFTQCAEAGGPETTAEEAPQPTLQDTIERGKYLVTAMGCHDCHSPKRMGERGPEVIPELNLSGYPGDRPFEKPPVDAVAAGWYLFGPDFTSSIGPWGVSFSANLTSDETGIGNWTFDQFLVALRKGKSKGLEANRDLLPPMPWEPYGKLSDADLAAVFAYLKSTPPVRNVVPPPIPPDQM